MRARVAFVLAPVLAALAACNLLIGLDGESQIVGASDGAVTEASTNGDGGLGRDGGDGRDGAVDGASEAGEVRLLAGDIGGAGYRDGPASAARFGWIGGVTMDGEGNVYVVDRQNVVIRKVAAGSNAVSTLAGAAHQRGTGDGAFSVARFDAPTSIAFDGASALYVSDMRSCSIRVLDLATAQVSTVVGRDGCGFADGNALPAKLQRPAGIVWVNGALYIADAGNSRVRKYVPATSEVSTVCGNGLGASVDGACAAVRIDMPTDIATDASGSKLYVRGSNRVQVIDLALLTLTTLTGSESGPEDGGLGPARFMGSGLDTASGTIFVGDGTRLRNIRPSVTSAPIGVTAGATESGWADGDALAARFEAIQAVLATDRAGLRLLVGDYVTLRAIDASGAVQTIAGRGTATGYADGPGPSARLGNVRSASYDGASTIYLYDSLNQLIRAFDLGTQTMRTVAGERGVNQTLDGDSGATSRFNDESDGIAYVGNGHLILSDGPNTRIRRIDVATGRTTTLTTERGLGLAMTSDRKGRVYYANDTLVGVWDESTPATFETIAGVPDVRGTADGIGDAARFNELRGICFDASLGALVVVDNAAGTVRRIDLATKSVTTIAGTPGQLGTSDGVGAAARFQGPTFVGCDGAGHAYITEVFGSTLRRIELATGKVDTVAGTSGSEAILPGPLPASLNAPTSPIPLGPKNVFLASGAEAALVEVRLP